MKTLYGLIAPYQQGMLKVSEIHDIYYEQCGNPNGQPVVFLHGGPGAGLTADYRRFFDPQAYRIVLFDQRGAGQSTPHACLEENTTWQLVSDIESVCASIWGLKNGWSLEDRGAVPWRWLTRRLTQSASARLYCAASFCAARKRLTGSIRQARAPSSRTCGSSTRASSPQPSAKTCWQPIIVG